MTTQYFLCTEDEFKRHISSEYYSWLMNHFFSLVIKRGIKTDNSVLYLKDGKFFLHPIELIQSLIDIKKKIELDPKSMIINQVAILNIDTFFGDEKKLKAKKILKIIFRQVCDFVVFKGMDIYLRLGDAIRLYQGYKYEINQDLEDISLIINQIFTIDERKKIHHDLNRQKEDF
jgi:hypothetical protein